MGMSMHVVGMIPSDEKYKKMFTILQQCNDLDISVPTEVNEFFDYVRYPDPSGYELHFSTEDDSNIISEWSDENTCSQGFEINLSNIPENVKTLRFYCAW